MNVLRALEVVLLMKASQSSTERAMSFIGDTVKGRFENVYRSGQTTKSGIDMVNVLTVLGPTPNLRSLNKEVAYEKYMATPHHYSVVWANKPLNHT